MKRLLDTHAFIWLDGDPARLSGKARAACADPANDLYLSLAALPAHHRDPFDRLIISQARSGGFELVTHDPEIAKYRLRILWD